MKKRNIIAILASVAVVVTMFTACNKGGEEPSTMVGEDGSLYEQITEAVTDAKGEAVTDAEGETKVVTVTKPYVPTTKNDGKAPATAGTTAPVESTTTYEDVTFPEGEKVEVEVDKDGRPQDCKMDKILKATAESKSFYLNCVAVTSDNFGLVETGINMKLYLKGNKFAVEMPMGVTTMRMAYDGKSMNLILPATKYYYSVEAGAEDQSVVEGMDMWGSIGSDSMEYVETTNVKIRGNEYLCETYTDSVNTNKYYFNSKDELKRIEIITADGTTSILKVNEVSSKVDDSIFSVPKGYTELTEEALEALGGSLGMY